MRQELDSSEDVEAVNSYRPFGLPLEGNGGDPYGYTGEWWNGYIKLTYLRSRWYDPGSSRFLSPDSIIPDYAFPPSIHRFTYVHNNPVNFTDPSGHCPPGMPQCRDEEGRPVDAYYIQCAYWDIGCQEHKEALTRRPPPPETYEPGYYSYIYGYDHDRDPLTQGQWELAKREADLFQLPVELVAATIATEIAHDTEWHDPILDAFLDSALGNHFCPSDSTWNLSVYLYQGFLDSFLSGYEHYWGLGDERGPGPGVANVHIGTAKAAEGYITSYYPEQHLLDPPPDIYQRMDMLLRDPGNVHYTAAILKQLADQRMGSEGNPALGSHIEDLTQADMQIIYGAFRAGWRSYGSRINDYQEFPTPGDLGRQSYLWLHFYEEKYRLESER